MKRNGVATRGSAAGGAPATAGYIRVSTASQDAASQRSAIESAARARGDAVERWYSDVASGGTMDRPELQRLRSELDARQIQRVYVWRLDRISRSGIGDTLAAVEHVKRCGATLISVSDPWLALEGPFVDLMLAVIAWGAQMERDKIRENQAAARARLEQQGRGWGRPPLPPHKKDAIPLLASQGLSIRQIARELQISRSSVGNVLGPKKR